LIVERNRSRRAGGVRPRLAQTGYGKRLQQALPPMKKLGTEAEFLVFLNTLPLLASQT
jgi:hypothetical protein